MSNFQSYYSCFSLSRDETTMHNTGYFFTRRCRAPRDSWLGQGKKLNSYAVYMQCLHKTAIVASV